MIKTPTNLKKITLLSIITVLMLLMLPNVKANSPTPLVYIDPPTIVGTTVGQEIDVTVMAKDFTNLIGWQAGLLWDPAILEGLTLYADSTLPDDVFDVLAPGVGTMWNSGTFDNTKGTLSYSGQNLKGVSLGVDATAGESYKLMKVKFKVKVVGLCDIHLSDVLLLKPEAGMPVEMQVYILDVFTAHDGDYSYAVNILTNSTGKTKSNIFGHQFVPASNALRFNLTSIKERDYATTTTGFCNVTIPRDLMWVDALSEWAVKVNDALPLSLTSTEDTTNYYIYFTYAHTGTLTTPAVLKIEITSTYAVPEFSTPMLLLPFILAAILTIAISRKLLTSKRACHVAT